MSTENNFAKLAAIDVSKHVEKKQNLSYLSWSWAVDQLMRHDPSANWEFHEPKMYGETMMVSCTVTAFGKPVTMHLPVMDHRNQAVKNPDAFVVNKNMMRCLVKTIACHGLGLYIYAGEDLPEQPPFSIETALQIIRNAANGGIDLVRTEAKKQWLQAPTEADKERITALVEELKHQQADRAAA